MQFAEILTANIMAGTDATAPRTGNGQSRSIAGKTAEFGKVLETAMSRVQNRSDVNRADTARRNNPADRSWENRLQRPQRRTGSPSVYDAQGRRKPEATDVEENHDNESTGRTMSADMLEVLAYLTGIDRMTLKEILTALGIPEEALSAREGFAGISAGISELLGLDAMQKDALADLMQLIEDAVGIHGTTEPVPGNDTGQSDGGTQPGLNLDGTGFQDAVGTVLSSAAEISAELRSAILMKTGEYASDPDADVDAGTVTENTRDAIMNIPGKVQFRRSNVSEPGEGTGPEAEQETEKAVPFRIEAAAHEEEAHEAESSGTGESGLAEKPALQQDTSAMHDAEAMDAGIIAVQQSNHGIAADVHVPVGRAASQPVSASQIISQIAEKASVILSHDKSEMMIELKPESLGRLSLKVVTENGIVMAKFVAENSQVQRLLESNMQMLRESLERQGIIVQDLSVSVRQDGGQAGGNGPQSRGLSGLRPKRSPAPAATEIHDEPWTAGIPGMADPWMWQGSTINLTA